MNSGVVRQDKRMTVISVSNMVKPNQMNMRSERLDTFIRAVMR